MIDQLVGVLYQMGSLKPWLMSSKESVKRHLKQALRSKNAQDSPLNNEFILAGFVNFSVKRSSKTSYAHTLSSSVTVLKDFEGRNVI